MRRFSTIIYVLSVILLFASCEREELLTGNKVPPGTPVTVTLSYTVPEMGIRTRSLTDAEESKIHDLYILLFSKNEESGSYVKMPGSRYYSTAELSEIAPVGNHSGAGQIRLENVESGKYYYIVGVANLMVGEMDSKGLRKVLDAVETLEAFGYLTFSLENGQNIDRVVPSLFMSGYYNPNPNDYHAKPVYIDGNDILDGTLHLRRADSRIRFIVQNDNPDVITRFEPVSWQVFNVPGSAYICEVPDENAGGVTYSNSKENIVFDKSRPNQAVFEFYMLENMYDPSKLDNPISPDTSDPYNERERKESDGFTHAPRNATYVVVKAKMEMNMGDYTRTAEVQYTVHLGYCEGDNNVAKANDFNCRRNTRYAYTVKIKGVDKIVLEAKKEGDLQPGAEGIVTDAVGGEQITVDAHYSAFNIALSPQEIAGMGYLFRTPFGNYDSGEMDAPFDPANCTWIRFAETTDRNTLVSYAGTADTKEEAVGGKKWLMNVRELKDNFSDADDAAERYFTVFVDEYVYADKNPGEYVNKPPRELFLYTAGDVSADGKSIYITGKYRFAQRSVQSYYREGAPSLLGVEHADETKGRNLNWSVTTASDNERKNWNADNGWRNVAEGVAGRDCGLVGKRWDEYAELTVPDNLGHKTFQMKQTTTRNFGKNEEAPNTSEFYEILRTCLSRNRDENRNGIIDAEELKWYLPTLGQYIQIYMGATALEHPLFDASSIPASEGNGGRMNCRNDYHFASSDCQKIFAEQGCSSNNPFWSNDGGSKWARNVRCVRNLRAEGGGTDMSAEGVSTLPDLPFIHDAGARTIEMTCNPLCMRLSFVPAGAWLARHDNFDYTLNSPYRKFQYAKGYVEVQWNNWVASLDDNSFCDEYSEEADGSDRGTWRFPNQRELNLIWLTGLRDNRYISGTKWKYDGRYCYVNANVSYLAQSQPYIRVRPVRDVR